MSTTLVIDSVTDQVGMLSAGCVCVGVWRGVGVRGLWGGVGSEVQHRNVCNAKVMSAYRFVSTIQRRTFNTADIRYGFHLGA